MSKCKEKPHRKHSTTYFLVKHRGENQEHSSYGTNVVDEDCCYSRLGNENYL